ncbi:MAG: menaquinone biosynthesis protein [Ferruginibacter sp.]|nr:menaquinone biosynthesis protein [Ferruginibacter sp.]
MDRKIRIAAVSYLNTKPLIYGFENGLMSDEINLVTDYPANIASLLKNDEVDIALVPVATIPMLKEHYIISNYCIGTIGEVASVCLFSNVPLEEIDSILLDYQSKTSVELLKILLKEFWKINPKLIFAKVGYEKNIEGKTAGLVIGDRAFLQRNKSKYIYDLGTAWVQFTGLPFVFAAWVCNKKLDENFLIKFNETTSLGLNNINKIIDANHYKAYDLNEYYNKNISYNLDDEKQKGLKLFLEKVCTTV